MYDFQMNVYLLHQSKYTWFWKNNLLSPYKIKDTNQCMNVSALQRLF